MKIIIHDFQCQYNNLKNLIGSPKKCYTFSCEGNPLTSLEGAPEYIERYFYADSILIHNLKYFPKFIGGYATLMWNNNLDSIEGLEGCTIMGDLFLDDTKVKETREYILSIANVRGNISIS